MGCLTPNLDVSITIETSKRTAIPNIQDSHITYFALSHAKDLGRRHPLARSRTSPSPAYNCHGLTFASRRTQILQGQYIATILSDDQYRAVSETDIMAGDIVVYYDESGDANHSGMVIELSAQFSVPIVVSKWGSAGEFIHNVHDCPNQYGPNKKYYRCQL